MRLISVLMLISVSVLLKNNFALATPDAATFAAHKTKALANLDERIKYLNEAKTCIAAAADMPAMKVCHEKIKSEHQAMRGEMMDERIHHMEERKKEIEAPKK